MDFEKVKNMIAEQLKVDPAEIKPESRLMEDLKADSANIMVMIMDMEDRFGTKSSARRSTRTDSRSNGVLCCARF